ncbi:hypothetical protein LLE49_09700 [Alicyclobacillus tolerans]|uniref:hypothetical protein n=1 Tax=Alicyclobacillus tolerans TaxID=90970 RepID=UPI001F2D2A2A|nr:hypothetical protein [Alicyclobacillus tolerans]MCF8564990.1 hypothetical protein [Alicyclobacillus tolerans]
MNSQKKRPIHLLFHSLSEKGETAYRIHTEDGLIEVAKLVIDAQGYITFIFETEFLQFQGTQLTDSLREAPCFGAVNFTSLFYFFLRSSTSYENVL